ncbi:MAG: hypothetical protein FWH06_03105 [Oscillospiraceae bacterium]|nr:hypothetical protein [Oscillospiraceae bacterium]
MLELAVLWCYTGHNSFAAVMFFARYTAVFILVEAGHRRMYKETKWARDIIALQDENGAWGYFHTLSEPNKYPITTEQALRRLCFLGYTIDDEVIKIAVQYMSDCLLGKSQIPDRREKLHDWDIFTNMMLSTWIRKFTKQNKQANETAETWAKIISSAFTNRTYNHSEYVKAYTQTFDMKPTGGRLVDFVSFYQVSLIADKLNNETENSVFDYILNHDSGIYYVYDRHLNTLPLIFKSKQASRYIGAVELLSAYRNSVLKLEFVADWLINNRNENGKWDMGSNVNDKVYFPLSNSWRRAENRETDCTYRIQKLISSIKHA